MRRLMKNSWKSKEEPVQIHLHFSPLLPPPAQRWLKFICYNRDTLISIKLFAIFVIPVYDASRFMLHFAGRKFSTFNTFPLVEHCSRLGHCQWSVIVVHFELPISFSIPCLFLKLLHEYLHSFLNYRPNKVSKHVIRYSSVFRFAFEKGNSNDPASWRHKTLEPHAVAFLHCLCFYCLLFPSFLFTSSRQSFFPPEGAAVLI